MPTITQTPISVSWLDNRDSLNNTHFVGPHPIGTELFAVIRENGDGPPVPCKSTDGGLTWSEIASTGSFGATDRAASFWVFGSDILTCVITNDFNTYQLQKYDFSTETWEAAYGTLSTVGMLYELRCALAPNGDVWIFYKKSALGTDVYARKYNGSWQAELTAGSFAGNYVSLGQAVIASDGSAHCLLKVELIAGPFTVTLRHICVDSTYSVEAAQTIASSGAAIPSGTITECRLYDLSDGTLCAVLNGSGTGGTASPVFVVADSYVTPTWSVELVEDMGVAPWTATNRFAAFICLCETATDVFIACVTYSITSGEYDQIQVWRRAGVNNWDLDYPLYFDYTTNPPTEDTPANHDGMQGVSIGPLSNGGFGVMPDFILDTPDTLSNSQFLYYLFLTYTLTLVKSVVGGDAVPADWTLSASGTAATFSGAGPSVSGDLSPGSTTLSESGGPDSPTDPPGPNGYEASNWSCDGGTLVGNVLTVDGSEGDITCTIVNTKTVTNLTGCPITNG